MDEITDITIKNEIADNIRIERLKKRISQEELAEKAGISTKYMNMIENRKANPTILIIVKICAALKITLKEIYNIDKIS